MRNYLLISISCLSVAGCAATQAQQAWTAQSNQITLAYGQEVACITSVKQVYASEFQSISKVLWAEEGDPPLSYLQNDALLSQEQKTGFSKVFDASQQCLNKYATALAPSSVELSNLISAYSKIRGEIALALVNDQITVGAANGYFRNLDREVDSLWNTASAQINSAYSAQHQQELAARSARIQAFGKALSDTYGPRPSVDVYVHD